jgi:hypothetical protein
VLQYQLEDIELSGMDPLMPISSLLNLAMDACMKAVRYLNENSPAVLMSRTYATHFGRSFHHELLKAMHPITASTAEGTGKVQPGEDLGETDVCLQTSKGLNYNRHGKGTWNKCAQRIELGEAGRGRLWLHGQKNFLT